MMRPPDFAIRLPQLSLELIDGNESGGALPSEDAS